MRQNDFPSSTVALPGLVGLLAAQERATPVMPKKIYVFWHSKDATGYRFAALSEDGKCLSTWLSESEEYANTIDMKSSQRLDTYNRHLPEGYTPVWRGGPVT